MSASSTSLPPAASTPALKASSLVPSGRRASTAEASMPSAHGNIQSRCRTLASEVIRGASASTRPWSPAVACHQVRPEMVEGPSERVFVVRNLLIECLPSLVETPEVEQSEGLDGAVLYRRDAQTRGQDGCPVTASGADREAGAAPIEPHRIEQMLIERDQVTAALQVAGNALEGTETVRIEVRPVGGTQGVHFQIVVDQLPGNGKEPDERSRQPAVHRTRQSRCADG